jgi:hypothetical protein
VAAEVVHDGDVVGLEDRHELLLDAGTEALALIGPSKTQGAVSRSQRSAPGKVSVRQWLCGAWARGLMPLEPSRATEPYWF